MLLLLLVVLVEGEAEEDAWIGEKKRESDLPLTSPKKRSDPRDPLRLPVPVGEGAGEAEEEGVVGVRKMARFLCFEEYLEVRYPSKNRCDEVVADQGTSGKGTADEEDEEEDDEDEEEEEEADEEDEEDEEEDEEDEDGTGGLDSHRGISLSSPVLLT